MLGRLILLFTVVPFAELALLIWIGDRIGFLPTVGLILVTGVLGASLARLQGLATWARFRRALEAGRLPGTELIEGLMILVAGAVLLTPGILTDLVGFTLLVPAARRFLVRWAEPRIRARATIRRARSGRAARPEAFGAHPRASENRPPAGEEVIDAEYEVVDPGRPDRDPEIGS